MHCNYFVLFDKVKKGPWEIEFIHNGGGLVRNKPGNTKLLSRTIFAEAY